MQYVLVESTGKVSKTVFVYVGYSWPTTIKKAKKFVASRFNGSAEIRTYNGGIGQCIFLAYFQDELVGVFLLYRS